MVLGKVQGSTVEQAAEACAIALKSIRLGRLRAQAGKAIQANEPEAGMMQLQQAAFHASVDQLEQGARTAMHGLQEHYQQFLDTWLASQSTRHRNEMLRLFKRTLKEQGERRRRGTRSATWK